MPKITTAIGERAYELVRNRVAEILIDELGGQQSINPITGVTNATVYIERFSQFDDIELPAVNVTIASDQFGQRTAVSGDGTVTYHIDGYASAPTTANERGDTLAMQRLQRLLGMCQAILMDSRYVKLDFDAPFIMSRAIASMELAKPQDAHNGLSMVMGRLTLNVRVPEEVSQATLNEIEEYSTQVKIGLTEKGYIFSGSNVPTPPVTGSEVSVNGNFFADLENPDALNIPVVNTLSDTVGTVSAGTNVTVGNSTVNLVDSGSNPIGSTDVAAEETAEITAPDATVENTNGSYSDTVASGGNLVLPNITFTDSDGSTSSVPSVQDITATPCTPSASVSISLDDDTPKLGQTVTITATVTGITATSHTFYLPQQDGSFETVTQASNTYDWTVSKYEDFTVTVTATDGSSDGAGSASGTTTGDIKADAIIAAQETAIGGTMDATAKDLVLGFMLRLKGIYTTFNENVFAQLEATNAELYAMFPDTSATASVAGYSINAIDPTRNAIMVGFVSGDATVNGLTGGSGRYMIMNNAPSDYGQNDVGVAAYIRGTQFACSIGAGDVDYNQTGTGVLIMSGLSSDRVIVKVNNDDGFQTSTAGNKVTFNRGFIYIKRESSDRIDLSNDGDVFDIGGEPSTTPSNELFYGMALNENGSPDRNYSGSVSCLINAPYLEECALKTLAEAVNWLQTQIGRNV